MVTAEGGQSSPNSEKEREEEGATLHVENARLGVTSTVANAGEAKVVAKAAESAIKATAQAISSISKEPGSIGTVVTQKGSKDMPPPRDKAILAGRKGSLQRGGR